MIKKRLFIGVMILGLLGSLSLATSSVEASSGGECSITIDANKHIDGVFAEPTGDCQGHIYGDYTANGVPAISGAVTRTVSDGEVVTFSIPRQGEYAMTVTFIPEKEEPEPEPEPEPTPEPKPDPEPEQETNANSGDSGSSGSGGSSGGSSSGGSDSGTSDGESSSDESSSGSSNSESSNGGSSSGGESTSNDDDQSSESSSELVEETEGEENNEDELEENEETEEDNDQEKKEKQRELYERMFLASIDEGFDYDVEDEEENKVMGAVDGNNSSSSGGFPVLPILIITGIIISGVFFYLYKYKGKFRKVLS